MARVVDCLSVRNGCIVAERCGIGPRLLLITNRKLHIAFHMTQKSFAGLPTPAYGRPFLATVGLLVSETYVRILRKLFEDYNKLIRKVIPH